MNRGTVVVDASALVAAVVDAGSIGRQARERLADCRLVAPFLVDAEVGSALRSIVLRGEISEKTAVVARLLAERMVKRRYPYHGSLAARAWELYQNVSFYDALYVALAESLFCCLVTADKRIARSLPASSQIHVIGVG